MSKRPENFDPNHPPHEPKNIPAQISEQIKGQVQEKFQAAKLHGQNLSLKLEQEIQQTQKSLQAKLEEIDVWAIAQANEVVDQTAENLAQAKHTAQQNLDRTAQKITTEASKTIENTGDRLKNAAKAAWDKFQG